MAVRQRTASTGGDARLGVRSPTPGRPLAASLFRPATELLVQYAGYCRDPRNIASMADDLALGRRTEVEAILGAVLCLAARCGAQAPCNTGITALVQGGPRRPQPMTGTALRHALGL